MPQANIYVFTEPRNWKNRPASCFPFMYDNVEQLEKQLLIHLREPGAYHVTAFSTYGELIKEYYLSPKTTGKAK